MAKFTYRGSPGYLYTFPDRQIEPVPGEVVELTADEAASVGDEFEAVKANKTEAPASEED